MAALLNPVDARVADDSFAAWLRTRVPAAHIDEYDALFETARILYGVRDDDAGPCAHWTLSLIRRVLLEAGARLAQRGHLRQPEHIFDATPSEVEALLGATGPQVSGEELASRAEARVASAANRPPSRLGEDEGPPPPDDWLPPAIARVNRALMMAMSIEYPAPTETSSGEDGKAAIAGLAASRGTYEGRACLVQGPDDFAKLRSGDILVASFTTTAYNVVLPLLGGVVTDKGGVLSHAAIVAREFALPAIVNTVNGTSVIVDGSRIRIDGSAGTVEVLHPGSPTTEPPSAPDDARQGVAR